jgi:hypothetical protein
MSQLDILTIDAKIKNTFREDYSKLPRYKEKLLDLQRTAKNQTFSARACRNLKTTISDLEEKIETLSCGQPMNFYIVETAHLIEIYKKILSTPVKLSFTGKQFRDDKEKKKVIENYL